MPPKTDKLVRADVVGKKNVIFDDDMSRECNFVRKNVVVADDAVVRDVRSDHQEVARSDARRLVCAAGPVQRAKLANDVVVADFQVTALAVKLHVLRLAAHDGVFEDAVSGPDFRKLFDDGVSPNLAIWANFHVIFDNGGRMYGH